MTVREILTLASQFLNKEEDFQSDIASTSIDTTSKSFKILFNALNIIACEIATDYFPLMIQEEIDIQNNKIYFDDLTKKIKDVYSIFSIDGSTSYRFKTFENYINVFAGGKVIITYSYLPETFSLDGSLSNFGGKMSARTIALGVVAEYLYISGIFDEAKVWHKRFNDSITANLSKKGIIKIPKRKWL